MPKYLNLGRDSGIVSYEMGDDWIEVSFSQGRFRTYTYTYSSAGSAHVENMKQLAGQGHGLNEYIKRRNPQYSSKK